MLDVIHLIVTVLSDHPSFEWECDVTGRPIWSSEPFRHVSVLLLLSNGMDAMLFGGLAKGWWVVLGMVTEGSDWVVLTSRFYVTTAREKAQLLYAGCASFTVDWLFWNLYGSYISPRPLLSWKKPGNFSFDNMGLLRLFEFKQNAIAMLFCYILRALWHHKCKWIQLPLSVNSLPKGLSELAMP